MAQIFFAMSLIYDERDFVMNDDFIKNLQDGFLVEADELIDQAESLCLSIEKTKGDSSSFDQIKRVFHNFKGSSKAVGFDELANFAHNLENLLIALKNGEVSLTGKITNTLLECVDRMRSDVKALKKDRSVKLDHTQLKAKIVMAQSGREAGEVPKTSTGPSTSNKIQKNDHQQSSTSTIVTGENEKSAAPNMAFVNKSAVDEFIRVPLKKIDDLLNAFGEQVIYLSALDFYKEDLNKYRDDIIRSIFNLKKTAFDLQQSTLTLRMINLKATFSKLERAIRDAAYMTGKQVQCFLHGADNELDKVIVDQLSDPLIHLARNAVDHGLELPKDRKAKGKPEVGMIHLRARREGVSFVIEIEDDGGGLDPARLAEKAISLGLINQDHNLSREELLNLIFKDGFSTKDVASEISGRGVGMNIVKETILHLKGTHEIFSEVNKGTLFRIKLPLTLSLFNGLLVMIGGQKFIIPSSQIQEIVRVLDVQGLDIDSGSRVIQMRDEILELLDINKILGRSDDREFLDRKKDMILIATIDRTKIGFVVSQVLGVHRTVQKPISPEMTACPGASGVTILGDGTPAIILDLRYLRDFIHGNKSSGRHIS